MGRAPCCEKVGLKRGRWTAEEDEKLRKYIEENGEGSWRSLPKNAGLLRCGKSCRLRWINYLRSDLKRGSISAEEEEIIINLHASMGNRWSLIAAHLAGRTDNEIKNYWNSHLSRKIYSFRRPNPQFIIPPPPPPPPKAKKTKNRRGGGPKQQHEEEEEEKEAAAGAANGAVLMPTTPTPESESVGRILDSEKRREERGNEERERVQQQQQQQQGGDFLGDINMMEDMSWVWGPGLGEMENEFGPGEVGSGLEGKETEVEELRWEIHENNFSWIWDENWNYNHQQMEFS